MLAPEKENEIRSLESLTIPGQREAVERFLKGSPKETFEFNDDLIVIKEDKEMMEKWRYPAVSALDSRTWEEIQYALVHDLQTHIAQQINLTMDGKNAKWYGTVIRDTIEAIIWIPSFEIVHFGYHAIFLIKRGYIPTREIHGKGYMSRLLVHKSALELDMVLSEDSLGASWTDSTTSIWVFKESKVGKKANEKKIL